MTCNSALNIRSLDIFVSVEHPIHGCNKVGGIEVTTDDLRNLSLRRDNGVYGSRNDNLQAFLKAYLAVYRQVVPTNDHSSWLWIGSKCITVPFEGPSSLLEGMYSDCLLCDCMWNSHLEIR